MRFSDAIVRQSSRGSETQRAGADPNACTEDAGKKAYDDA
jgi:hypothetical protein